MCVPRVVWCMSSPPMTDRERIAGLFAGRSLPGAVAGSVKRVAFWGAIALPFTYVPLVAAGIDSVSTLLAFAFLVALHVCSLVVGHSYKR
jgi:hypothetical protein